MEEIFYPSHDNVTTIHACLWKPQGEVIAVLQIFHGMSEYAERYAPFAENLTKHGIVVVAEDHLGHGLSVTDSSKLGYFCEKNPVDTVLADMFTLTQKAKELFPHAPLFVMGHSMGSFFCRNFVAKHGKDLSGAVIMGTGWQTQAMINFALTLTRREAKKNGWEYCSPFINNAAFGSYNKRFKPARTNYDWLSVSTQNIDTYLADPLCGFPFTCNGFYTLFSVIKRACNENTIAKTPKSLPLYLVSGDQDPVGSYGKGVVQTYKAYQKAGVDDVELTLYRGFRHEILNDDCAEQVTSDIIDFIFNHLPKPATKA
jgi:alpha-beta hydrolase superfamily lysophospholipase